MKKKNILKWIIMCLFVILLILGGIFLFKRWNDDLIHIENPITEVKGLNEMKNYLGYDVPSLKKSVKKYYVIGDTDFAMHARIVYYDDTQFDMERGITDVIGIFGGVFEKEEEIEGIMVKYYSYEDTKYIIWSNNDFSYSYSDYDYLDNDEVITFVKLTK